MLSGHSVKTAVFIHLKNYQLSKSACTDCLPNPAVTKAGRERCSDCNDYYTQLFTNCLKRVHKDFPGGPVVENMPTNAGDTLGPHGAEQLSPRAATTEALEPVLCNKRSCCNEMPMNGN